jgi:hypothetical protein
MKIASNRQAQQQGADLAICDFRIEDSNDEFALVVRRQFGPSAVFAFAIFGLMFGVGAWFLGSFLVGGAREAWRLAHSTASATAPSARGPPVCCVPFVVLFIGFWMSLIARAALQYSAGLRGRERWVFVQSGVVPPRSEFVNKRSPLVAIDGLRAGLCSVGKRWGIGFSSGQRDLILGPFVDEAMARRCEAELRHRRPGWFVQADGTPAPYGLQQWSPVNRTAPEDAIVHFEQIPGEVDRVWIRIERRRAGKVPPGGTGFLAVWLCAWAVGEILTGVLIGRRLIGWFHTGQWTTPGALKEPPIAFISIWFVGWTFGGFFAIRQLVLRFKHRETWSFEPYQITAGRNWQFDSKRHLPISGELHVRLLPGDAGPALEFVSGGISLCLGPFADEASARILWHNLVSSRPGWHWPNLK